MEKSEQLNQQAPHFYQNISEVPKPIKKYWNQRYNIFSRYDEGIWFTEDAWFGVTPEPVANQIALHVAQASPSEKTTLVDAFAGVGGNVIAFALTGRWERIFAIEQDAAALECAKHNAEIYGVYNKIWWIHGDCFKLMKRRFGPVGKSVVIFASPPWGGPSYADDTIFDLNSMQPYSLSNIYKSFSSITRELTLYLPRTSDLNQIAKYADKEKKLPVVHYCMDGYSKAMCVYFGNMNIE